MHCAEQLKNWFIREQRSFPWRDAPLPYSVWVSEIMLQQTQAAVVIPYFERWMRQFPTIEALAAAPLSMVIKAWEGLGYYSRARNLHAGAQYVLENHGGILPDHPELLKKIKGIGPYTVGAIRSFAFHQKAAAVDGNVMRVMARYHHISEDICLPKTIKQVSMLTEQFLPDNEPWVVMEALIELGATICTKSGPKCTVCPLKKNCQAHRQGHVHLLPFKSKKTTIEKLYREVIVLRSACGKFLVKQVEEGNIMSDLHEFPYFELASDSLPAPAQSKIASFLGLKADFETSLSKVKHSFTRFQVTLFPSLYSCKAIQDVPNYQWLSREDLAEAAFSSGHRRIYQSLIFKTIF